MVQIDTRNSFSTYNELHQLRIMYSMQEMYVAIHVCGSSIKSIGLLYLVGLEYAL